MSIRHVAAVLESDLPPNERMVAVVYAESANRDDDHVFLSIESVVEGSGYKERQARTLTGLLRARGVLELLDSSEISDRAWEVISGYRPDKRPNVYRFHLGCGATCKVCTPSETNGMQDSDERDAPTRRRGVRATAPKPEREPERNPIAWVSDLEYSVPDGWEPTATPHKWKTPEGTADLVWDSVLAACQIDAGSITRTARQSINRTVSELRDAGASPVDIKTRAARYRSGSGPVPQGARLTHNALRTHWPSLAGDSAVRRLERFDDSPVGHKCRWAEDKDDPSLDDRGRSCLVGKHWEDGSPF